MYLSELKLWNFRKYGSTSFDINKPDLIVPFLKGLNLLIGENDSGKSAILDAIKLVLKTHAYEWIKVEDSDFFIDENRDKSEKLRIEIHFSDISNNEAKNFIEWCGWDKEVIKDKEEMRPKLILIYQAEIRDNKVIPSDVKAGMDGVGHLLNAEAKEYLKCTYLKALRDADSELMAKKNSRLSEILQKHQLFKKTKGEDHPFETHFKTINTKIENHFKKNKNSNLYYKEIKFTIDNYLEKFIDDKTSSLFSLGKPEIKNILEKISLGIVDRSNLGLGTMNRLFMAAELLHLKRNWDGLKLCMIEELEAHLHPQAQMKIIETLKEQSNTGIQFILTTHSPNIASKIDLKSLIICKNNDAFPMGEYYTILGEEIKKSKYKNSYHYLRRFLDVTKSNLFFAKGVIIVEGWSEEILIPEIAKKLNNNLTIKEVSVVNVASVAYLHFAKIFLRRDKKDMRIPVAIIADLDLKAYERVKNGEEYIYVKNNIINYRSKKEKRTNEVFDLESNSVKPFVSKLWTFEWCLLKSEALNEIFKDILKSIHSGTFLNCNSNEDWEIGLATILLSESINKTEIAYQLAEKIKELPQLNIKKNDSIYYLVDAIKYSCQYGN